MLNNNFVNNNASEASLGFRCTQINLQKAIAPTTSLEQWMDDNRMEIGLLQEPYLRRNKVSGRKYKWSDQRYLW